MSSSPTRTVPALVHSCHISRGAVKIALLTLCGRSAASPLSLIPCCSRFQVAHQSAIFDCSNVSLLHTQPQSPPLAGAVVPLIIAARGNLLPSRRSFVVSFHRYATVYKGDILWCIYVVHLYRNRHCSHWRTPSLFPFAPHLQCPQQQRGIPHNCFIGCRLH